MKMHELRTQNMTTGYGTTPIVPNINLSIPSGKISVIIGANGCGKSTLLKSFCRLNNIMEGQILLDGKSILQYSSKEFAKTLGLLPQSPVVPEGISVADLVCRGRFPYRSTLHGLTTKDYEAVEEAMEIMGIAELADRNVDELSGGQRQRVWIALALAQQTDILFLDEPTTFLDIAYQIEILELLVELNRTKKTTIVMVLHDINQAARYGDHIFAMKEGQLVAEGAPEEIIHEDLIEKVFHMKSRIIKDPVYHTPYIIPIGKYGDHIEKYAKSS